jgi:hypothetical protein
MSKDNRTKRQKIMNIAWSDYKRAKSYAIRFGNELKSFAHYLSCAWKTYKRDYETPDTDDLDFAML